MKTRLLVLPLTLALVASLAACGGGSQSVPSNAIAVVNGQSITTAEFNSYFAQAVAQTVARGGTKPTPGSSAYTTLRNQVVAEVVQIAEVRQQAAKKGVTVTQSDVDKFIAKLIKTKYKGSAKKLASTLKAQGLTMKEAEAQVNLNLLATRMYAKVTKSAKVTTTQEQQYYNQNIAQYNVAAGTTRSVAYILVKSKSLADSIETKLANGQSFASLAKKYSTDTTTKDQGGKFTANKGQVVPAFDKVAFSMKTGKTSAPVDATSTANKNYGWFIIQALGPVKDTKAHTIPFKQEEASIHTTLLTQAQRTLWTQWLTDLQNSYKGKVTYRSSYAPPPTTALSTTPTG